MRRMKVKLFYILAVTLLITACSGNKPVKSRLDEKTGVTVVTMQSPVVLARPNRLSVAARDYAYLGPVEVNRMDEREHFLWIGLASTVDRERIFEPPPNARALALVVDGIPITMPLTEWSTDLVVPPYDGNSPIYSSLAARASLDEIKQIAGAESVEMNIITESGSSVAYRHWDGDWAGWASFAAFVPGNP